MDKGLWKQRVCAEHVVLDGVDPHLCCICNNAVQILPIHDN